MFCFFLVLYFIKIVLILVKRKDVFRYLYSCCILLDNYYSFVNFWKCLYKYFCLKYIFFNF